MKNSEKNPSSKNPLSKAEKKELKKLLSIQAEKGKLKKKKAARLAELQKANHDSKKEEKPQSNSKPGIIKSIAKIIIDSGKEGISKNEILENLAKQFGEDRKAGMQATVNAQIPNRMNKEKNLSIIRMESGNYRNSDKKLAKQFLKNF